jgi:single-strand DNA-binding protein
MNKIVISGNVGYEPKFKVSKEGTEFAIFSVAVSRKYNHEVTDWFTCNVYGELCTKCVKPFIHSGTKLNVAGPIEFGSYEKNGVKIPTTTLKVEEIEIIKQSENHNSTEQQSIENNETPKVEVFDDTKNLPF